MESFASAMRPTAYLNLMMVGYEENYGRTVRATKNLKDTAVEYIGGGRQRISIARAMLKNAPVVILDEATANVDPENEKELTGVLSARDSRPSAGKYHKTRDYGQALWKLQSACSVSVGIVSMPGEECAEKQVPDGAKKPGRNSGK